MFYRLDLLVTPHPKSLGLDTAYWTQPPAGREGSRRSVDAPRPAAGRRESTRAPRS